MSEEIIIDGVDVTKCCWCDFEPDTEPYCRINDGEDLDCESNSDCYFKQLKRKEQECKKLESKLNKIYNLSTSAFCLTHGTNKDMANFAKQILCLIRRRRMR